MDKKEAIKELYKSLLLFTRKKSKEAMSIAQLFQKLNAAKTFNFDSFNSAIVDMNQKVRSAYDGIPYVDYSNVELRKLHRSHDRMVKGLLRGEIQNKKEFLEQTKQKINTSFLNKDQKIREKYVNMRTFNNDLKTIKFDEVKVTKLLKNIMFAFFGFNSSDRYADLEFKSHDYYNQKEIPVIIFTNHFKERYAQRVNRNVEDNEWLEIESKFIDYLKHNFEYSNISLTDSLLKMPSTILGDSEDNILYIICAPSREHQKLKLVFKTIYESMSNKQALQLIRDFITQYEQKPYDFDINQTNEWFVQEWIAKNDKNKILGWEKDEENWEEKELDENLKAIEEEMLSNINFDEDDY